jgi:Histidinol dehydrogenase
LVDCSLNVCNQLTNGGMFEFHGCFIDDQTRGDVCHVFEWRKPVSTQGVTGVYHVHNAIRQANQRGKLHRAVQFDYIDLATLLRKIAAGAVHKFGGNFQPCRRQRAVGDYCAGPNHVLPTSRTARFSSPLGVYDFQKRSSLIDCSAEGASTLGKIASILARGEGLIAHARSAEYRIKD